MICAPGDAVQQILQLSEHIRRRQICRPAFGNDIDVPLSSDALPVVPKVFPNEAFDPISPNGLSHFFGGGYPQTTALNRRGKHGHEKRSVNPPTLPEQMEKLLPFSKSVRLGKCCSAQPRRPCPAPGPASPPSTGRPKTAMPLIAFYPLPAGGLQFGGLVWSTSVSKIRGSARAGAGWVERYVS